jgi:hypothetical protein
VPDVGDLAPDSAQGNQSMAPRSSTQIGLFPFSG